MSAHSDDLFEALVSLNATLASTTPVSPERALELGLGHLPTILPCRVCGLIGLDALTLKPILKTTFQATCREELEPWIERIAELGLLAQACTSTMPVICPLPGEDRLVLQGCVSGGYLAAIFIGIAPANQLWTIRLTGLSLACSQMAMAHQARLLAFTVEKQKDTLEEEVFKRTLELSHARQQADAASLAKSRFLATMSHEIRTPMNGVLGMIQILIGSRPTVEQLDFLVTAQRSGETLLAILNDVLDLSKIEADQLQLEVAPFDPSRVCSDAIDLFRGRVAVDQVELILDLAPDVPALMSGDHLRLRQVITNLLSNACKFTSHGHISLTATCIEGDLHISIEDSGAGIATESLATVFEPYRQEDDSVARRFGGTGLGLSICKRLVTAMGGTITVTSIKGTGTTVSVRLPMINPCPAQHDIHELSGMRLLVVCTHKLSGMAFMRQLALGGATVEIAASIGDARAALAHAAPAHHAVLIEAYMPDHDAARLFAEIRAKMAHQALPVAFWGISPDMSEVERGCPFILVPQATELIACAVARLLGRETKAVIPVEERTLHGRVLMAEDNPVNQKVGQIILRRMGLNVTLVADGLQAVERWREGNFDVILMDVQMPGMDGLEATRMIRQAESVLCQSPIPIIALTAGAMGEERKAAIDAGMDEVLAKPYREQDLADVLLRWLPPQVPPGAQT